MIHWEPYGIKGLHKLAMGGCFLQLHLFESWKMDVGSQRGRIMWKVSFMAIIWVIWKEHSAWCFQGKVTMRGDLVEKVYFLVSSWVSPSFMTFPFPSLWGVGLRWPFPIPLTLPFLLGDLPLQKVSSTWVLTAMQYGIWALQVLVVFFVIVPRSVSCPCRAWLEVVRLTKQKCYLWGPVLWKVTSYISKI